MDFSRKFVYLLSYRLVLMKIRHLSLLLLLLPIQLLLCGCSGVDSSQRTEACFTTQHHENVIPNIDVFVKFHTVEFPGYFPEEQFDLKLTSDAQGRVCFRDFPLGSHWFVGIGFDEEIREMVIGNNNYHFDLNNLKVEDILFVGEE